MQHYDERPEPDRAAADDPIHVRVVDLKKSYGSTTILKVKRNLRAGRFTHHPEGKRPEVPFWEVVTKRGFETDRAGACSFWWGPYFGAYWRGWGHPRVNDS